MHILFNNIIMRVYLYFALPPSFDSPLVPSYLQVLVEQTHLGSDGWEY